MKCVYIRICHHIKCHIYHIYISIIIDKLQLQLRFTIRSVQIVASAVYKYTTNAPTPPSSHLNDQLESNQKLFPCGRI